MGIVLLAGLCTEMAVKGALLVGGKVAQWLPACAAEVLGVMEVTVTAAGHALAAVAVPGAILEKAGMAARVPLALVVCAVLQAQEVAAVADLPVRAAAV